MRQKIFRLFFLLSVIVTVMATSIIYAVDTIKISEIRKDPFKYKNEVVNVEGFITQYLPGETSTTKFYFLRGDWGNLLKTLTEKAPPGIGHKYKIRGIIIIDETSNDIYLIELQRQCLTCPVENNFWLYILIGIGAFFLILTIVIAIKLTKKHKHEYLTPVPGQEASDELDVIQAATGASIIEGSTIKISTPPPGTLKLLPGRLEVISGDDTVKEIRFYKPKTQQEPEITFGRSTGPSYTHIQLKPMTVSAKHAKIIYMDQKFTLINYSSTNPTVVNDQPMESNSSIELSGDDKIEMGEVVFRFHAK